MILILQSKCICQMVISLLCVIRQSFPLENSHLYLGHITNKTFNCLGYMVSRKSQALFMLLYKLQLIHNIKCRSAGAF